MDNLKNEVHDFWSKASCGEDLYLKGESEKQMYINQTNERYKLEPEILRFANFDIGKNKKVLEIGVGLGSDHQRWAESGAELYGCDLTQRAVSHTENRLKIFGLKSNLMVGDAENLKYPENYFDIVYSWGVIHHSPNTEKAVNEIRRVLKPNGIAKIMIYHTYSVVGFMLWVRYALLKFRPFYGLKNIYNNYLESPGTKAYSYNDARTLFKEFKILSIESPLSHGDLLSKGVGQRHSGFILQIAKRIFPRKLIKLLFPQNGLYLMLKLQKVM